MYRYEVEFSSRSADRSPVTCAACGCRLQAATGARDGEYFHFSPLGGRDARGCRVDCVDAAHDSTGRPVFATV